MPARSPMRPGIETGMLASYAMTACPASCYVWLGEYGKARSYAEGVTVHEAAPAASRSPSREAIARIDLAMALAGLGVPGEAAAVGLQAPGSSQVADSVQSRAADLDAMLMARYPDQAEARSFHERYRSTATPHLAVTEG